MRMALAVVAASLTALAAADDPPKAGSPAAELAASR